MIRMSWFIMGIFFGLRSFSPIQNSQNTCKNAQNVEIYHGNFLGVTIIFNHTKWPKHLQKFSDKKIFRKCSECWDLSQEFFWGYDHFHPYNMAKTLVKILRQKNFQKMLRMSRFITRIFLGLRSISPIKNGQNTCINSQTKQFSKNTQNVEI